MSDGARELEFHPTKMSYTPGEKITATAAGNPAPTFVWSYVEGKGHPSSSGNTLTVTPSMSFHIYSCNASNTLVNGAIMSVTKIITFSVTGKKLLFGKL